MIEFEWSPEAIKAVRREMDRLAKNHRLWLPSAATEILNAAVKAQPVVAAHDEESG